MNRGEKFITVQRELDEKLGEREASDALTLIILYNFISELTSEELRKKLYAAIDTYLQEDIG